MQDLSVTLERLRDASANLNKLSTELNSYVSRVENYLEECGVGIPVSITTGDGLKLSYCRLGSKFRLVVVAGEAVTPWSDSSRDVKLRTISALPDLLAQLEQAIKQNTATVSATLDELAKSFPQLAKQAKPSKGHKAPAPTPTPAPAPAPASEPPTKSDKSKTRVVGGLVVTELPPTDPNSVKLTEFMDKKAKGK